MIKLFNVYNHNCVIRERAEPEKDVYSACLKSQFINAKISTST